MCVCRGGSGKVSSCGPVNTKPSQPRPRTRPLLLRKCAAGSQDSLRLPPLSDVRTVRRRLHAGEDDIPPGRLDTVRSDVCQDKTFVFVSIS